jgi:hypothetical protein
MIGLQVRGAERTIANLARAAREAGEAGRDSVRDASFVMRRKIIERLSKAGSTDAFWGKRSPAGAYLGGRSGKTRQRISPAGIVFKHGNSYQAAVGSPDVHMAFHEGGGTITGHPYLRIPTAAAQTPAGVDRNLGRSLRDVPGVFLITSRAGKLWAATRQGRTLQLLYLLVRAVTQRPRNLMGTVAREMDPELLRLGLGKVSAVVQRANT